MNKKRFTVLLLLVALILVGAGCGKYSTPEKTIESLFNAISAKDKEAYLECFSDKTIELFNETGEEIDMESISQGMPEEIPEIEVLEKKGDTAVVQTKAANSSPMVLKKENGKWKIDIEATIERNTAQ